MYYIRKIPSTRGSPIAWFLSLLGIPIRLLEWFLARFDAFNPNEGDVWKACQVRGGGAPGAPPIYLSHLWSDFQNSFVWWKLVKIVIDCYSISDFLLFTVWPLDVTEVMKVCCVNFFKKKIQNFKFLARNTWYTSNESWDYVEFKFIAKKYDLIEKNEKKILFLIFASKTRLTRCLRRPISRYYIKKISKVASPGAGRSFNLKSHQRRALYLCTFGIGRRSTERWASGAPPDLDRVKKGGQWQ